MRFLLVISILFTVLSGQSYAQNHSILNSYDALGRRWANEENYDLTHRQDYTQEEKSFRHRLLELEQDILRVYEDGEKSKDNISKEILNTIDSSIGLFSNKPLKKANAQLWFFEVDLQGPISEQNIDRLVNKAGFSKESANAYIRAHNNLFSRVKGYQSLLDVFLTSSGAKATIEVASDGPYLSLDYQYVQQRYGQELEKFDLKDKEVDIFIPLEKSRRGGAQTVGGYDLLGRAMISLDYLTMIDVFLGRSKTILHEIKHHHDVVKAYETNNPIMMVNIYKNVEPYSMFRLIEIPAWYMNIYNQNSDNMDRFNAVRMLEMFYREIDQKIIDIEDFIQSNKKSFIIEKRYISNARFNLNPLSSKSTVQYELSLYKDGKPFLSVPIFVDEYGILDDLNFAEPEKIENSKIVDIETIERGTVDSEYIIGRKHIQRKYTEGDAWAIESFLRYVQKGMGEIAQANSLRDIIEPAYFESQKSRGETAGSNEYNKWLAYVEDSKISEQYIKEMHAFAFKDGFKEVVVEAVSDINQVVEKLQDGRLVEDKTKKGTVTPSKPAESENEKKDSKDFKEKEKSDLATSKDPVPADILEEVKTISMKKFDAASVERFEMLLTSYSYSVEDYRAIFEYIYTPIFMSARIGYFDAFFENVNVPKGSFDDLILSDDIMGDPSSISREVATRALDLMGEQTKVDVMFLMDVVSENEEKVWVSLFRGKKVSKAVIQSAYEHIQRGGNTTLETIVGIYLKGKSNTGGHSDILNSSSKDGPYMREPLLSGFTQEQIDADPRLGQIEAFLRYMEAGHVIRENILYGDLLRMEVIGPSKERGQREVSPQFLNWLENPGTFYEPNEFAKDVSVIALDSVRDELIERNQYLHDNYDHHLQLLSEVLSENGIETRVSKKSNRSVLIVDVTKSSHDLVAQWVETKSSVLLQYDLVFALDYLRSAGVDMFNSYYIISARILGDVLNNWRMILAHENSHLFSLDVLYRGRLLPENITIGYKSPTSTFGFPVDEINARIAEIKYLVHKLNLGEINVVEFDKLVQEKIQEINTFRSFLELGNKVASKFKGRLGVSVFVSKEGHSNSQYEAVMPRAVFSLNMDEYFKEHPGAQENIIKKFTGKELTWVVPITSQHMEQFDRAFGLYEMLNNGQQFSEEIKYFSFENTQTLPIMSEVKDMLTEYAEKYQNIIRIISQRIEENASNKEFTLTNLETYLEKIVSSMYDVQDGVSWKNVVAKPKKSTSGYLSMGGVGEFLSSDNEKPGLLNQAVDFVSKMVQGEKGKNNPLHKVYGDIAFKGVTSTSSEKEQLLYLSYLNHVSKYYDHVVSPYDVISECVSGEKEAIFDGTSFDVTFSKDEKVVLKSMSYEERIFSTSIDGFCRTNLDTSDERNSFYEYYTVLYGNGKLQGKITVSYGRVEEGSDKKIVNLQRIQNIPKRYIVPFLNILSRYYNSKGYEFTIPLSFGSHKKIQDISDSKVINEYYREIIEPLESDEKRIYLNFEADGASEDRAWEIVKQSNVPRVFSYQQIKLDQAYEYGRIQDQSPVDLSEVISKVDFGSNAIKLLDQYYEQKDYIRYLNLIRLLSYYNYEFKVHEDLQSKLTGYALDGTQKSRRNILFSLFVAQEEGVYKDLKIDLNKMFFDLYDQHILEASKTKKERNITKYTAVIDMLDSARQMFSMGISQFDYFLDGQDVRFSDFINAELNKFLVMYFSEGHSDKLNHFRDKYKGEKRDLILRLVEYMIENVDVLESPKDLAIQLLKAQDNIIEYDKIEKSELSAEHLLRLLNISILESGTKPIFENSSKTQALYHTELNGLFDVEPRFKNRFYAANVLQLLLANGRGIPIYQPGYINFYMETYPDAMTLVLSMSPNKESIFENINEMEGLSDRGKSIGALAKQVEISNKQPVKEKETSKSGYLSMGGLGEFSDKSSSDKPGLINQAVDKVMGFFGLKKDASVDFDKIASDKSKLSEARAYFAQFEKGGIFEHHERANELELARLDFEALFTDTNHPYDDAERKAVELTWFYVYEHANDDAQAKEELLEKLKAYWIKRIGLVESKHYHLHETFEDLESLLLFHKPSNDKQENLLEELTLLEKYESGKMPVRKWVEKLPEVILFPLNNAITAEENPTEYFDDVNWIERKYARYILKYKPELVDEIKARAEYVEVYGAEEQFRYEDEKSIGGQSTRSIRALDVLDFYGRIEAWNKIMLDRIKAGFTDRSIYDQALLDLFPELSVEQKSLLRSKYIVPEKMFAGARIDHENTLNEFINDFQLKAIDYEEHGSKSISETRGEEFAGILGRTNELYINGQEEKKASESDGEKAYKSERRVVEEVLQSIFQEPILHDVENVRGKSFDELEAIEKEPGVKDLRFTSKMDTYSALNIENLALKPSDIVINIGSGRDYAFADKIFTKYGAFVFQIDPIYNEQMGDHRYVKGVGEDLPFKNEVATYVSSFETLSTNDVSVLLESIRVLTNNGLADISYSELESDKIDPLVDLLEEMGVIQRLERKVYSKWKKILSFRKMRNINFEDYLILYEKAAEIHVEYEVLLAMTKRAQESNDIRYDQFLVEHKEKLTKKHPELEAKITTPQVEEVTSTEKEDKKIVEEEKTTKDKIKDVLRGPYVSTLKALGLFDAVVQYKLHADFVPLESIIIEGVEVKLGAPVGYSYASVAYRIEYQGKPSVITITNSNGQQKLKAIQGKVDVYERVKNIDYIHTPDVYAYDVEKGWIIAEFIEGEKLIYHGTKSYIQKNKAPLMELYEGAKRFYAETGVMLDISNGDNVILKDGKAYLVDLGPLSKSIHETNGVAGTYEEQIERWLARKKMIERKTLLYRLIEGERFEEKFDRRGSGREVQGSETKNSFGNLRWYERLLFKPVMDMIFSEGGFIDNLNESLEWSEDVEVVDKYNKPESQKEEVVEVEEAHPDERYWKDVLKAEEKIRIEEGIVSERLERIYMTSGVLEEKYPYLAEYGIEYFHENEIALNEERVKSKSKYFNEKHGITHLHRAILMKARWGYIKYLMDTGYDINDQTSRENSAYHLMIEKKRWPDELKQIREKYNVNHSSVNIHGNDFVMTLILQGFPTDVILEHLEYSSLDINRTNKLGFSKLESAVLQRSDDKLIQELILRGCDVTQIKEVTTLFEIMLRIGVVSVETMQIAMDSIDSKQLDPRSNRRMYLTLLQHTKYKSLVPSFHHKLNPKSFGPNQNAQIVVAALSSDYTESERIKVLDRIPNKFWNIDNLYRIYHFAPSWSDIQYELSNYLYEIRMNRARGQGKKIFYDVVSHIEEINGAKESDMDQEIKRVMGAEYGKKHDEKSVEKGTKPLKIMGITVRNTYQYVLPKPQELKKMDAFQIIVALQKVPVSDIQIEGERYQAAVAELDLRLVELRKDLKHGVNKIEYVALLEELRSIAKKSMENPIWKSKYDEMLANPKPGFQKAMVQGGHFAVALVVADAIRIVIDPDVSMKSMRDLMLSMPYEMVRLFTFTLGSGYGVQIYDKIESQLTRQVGRRLENKVAQQLDAQAAKGAKFSRHTARRIVRGQIGFVAGLATNMFLWDGAWKDPEWGKNLFYSASTFMGAQVVVKSTASGIRLAISAARKGAKGFRLMALEGGPIGWLVAAVELGVEMVIASYLEEWLRGKEVQTSLENQMRFLSKALHREIVGQRDNDHIPQMCADFPEQSKDSIQCISMNLNTIYEQYLQYQILEDIHTNFGSSIENEEDIVDDYEFVHTDFMKEAYIIDQVDRGYEIGEAYREYKFSGLVDRIEKLPTMIDNVTDRELSYENYKSMINRVGQTKKGHLEIRQEAYQGLYEDLSSEVRGTLHSVWTKKNIRDGVFKQCRDLPFDRIENCIIVGIDRHEQMTNDMLEKFYRDSAYQFNNSWYQRMFNSKYNGTFLGLEWSGDLDMNEMVQAIRSKGRSTIATMEHQLGKIKDEQKQIEMADIFREVMVGQMTKWIDVYEDIINIKSGSELKEFAYGKYAPSVTSVHVGYNVMPDGYLYPQDYRDRVTEYEEHETDMLIDDVEEMSVWLPFEKIEKKNGGSYYRSVDEHAQSVRMEVATTIVQDLWDDINREVFTEEHGQKLDDVKAQIDHDRTPKLDGRYIPINLHGVYEMVSAESWKQHYTDYKSQWDTYLENKSDIAWKLSLLLMPDEDEDVYGDDATYDDMEEYIDNDEDATGEQAASEVPKTCYQVQYYKEDVNTDHTGNYIYSSSQTVTEKPFLHRMATLNVTCAQIQWLRSSLEEAMQ